VQAIAVDAVAAARFGRRVENRATANAAGVRIHQDGRRVFPERPSGRGVVLQVRSSLAVLQRLTAELLVAATGAAELHGRE